MLRSCDGCIGLFGSSTIGLSSLIATVVQLMGANLSELQYAASLGIYLLVKVWYQNVNSRNT